MNSSPSSGVVQVLRETKWPLRGDRKHDAEGSSEASNLLPQIQNSQYFDSTPDTKAGSILSREKFLIPDPSKFTAKRGVQACWVNFLIPSRVGLLVVSKTVSHRATISPCDSPEITISAAWRWGSPRWIVEELTRQLSMPWFSIFSTQPTHGLKWWLRRELGKGIKAM